MKKVWVYLLVLAMLASFLVFPVSAEEYSGSCGDNATWTFDPETGTLTISGTGPAKGFYGDSSDGWRPYTSQIFHVVFEEGIIAIEGLFSKLYKMQSLQIADSVKTIGDWTFMECDSLEYVDLGQGVTSLGDMCFSGDYSLDTLILPESLQDITGEAFSCCGLKTLALPEGTTVINNGTFRANMKLEKLYLPASVTKINYAAFRDCEALKDVYFAGTQAQWEAIDINLEVNGKGSSNGALTTATIHYEHSHSFDDGTVTRQATCAQKGVKTYTCTVCNAAKQETFEGDHTWDEGEQDGRTMTYTCTVCSTTKTEEVPLTDTPTNNMWILYIVLGVLVAGGTVAAVIILKKRKKERKS